MSFAGALASVIGLLDDAGIPFMVTGSLAGSYHGEPRSTFDIDLVIDPDANQLDGLVDAFLAAGWYVDRDAARAALAARGQFNAIGPGSIKVDCLIRRDRPFSVEEFARRQPADLLGTDGFVATAEDLVLAKLEWAAGSGSERQLRDVAGIVALNPDLDTAYIERWAAALGVAEAWEALRT